MVVATEIERPWIDHYPPGIPPTIDADAAGTIVDIIRNGARQFSSRPAFSSFGKEMTFAQMQAAADAVASWVQAQGCARGERIALMMPNVMAYPACIFGVLAAGCTVVNVNPLYTARELTHQLKDSGATSIFILEMFAHTLQESLKSLPNLKRVVIVRPGDLLGLKGSLINFVAKKVKKAVAPWSIPGAISFTEVFAKGRARKFEPVSITQSDIAFLQYTGGTTGVAKGATLTHRNVAANVIQTEAFLRARLNDREGEIMVTALPLYHIFGLTCCCILMWRVGVMCLLIANPRDFDAFIAMLKKYKVTMFSGVNTLYNALTNHPKIGEVDFSKLVISVAGGMSTQQVIARNWKKLTGTAIIEGYGLSETSPVSTLNSPDLVEFSGTIGFPVPSTDIVIRDDNGANLPAGQSGELCVRGPQVMAGYWQRPDETAKVMTADGFFRTGDLAVMLPDGQFKIVDRLKDMILVSGFNVYPNEVEDVLAEHPGVLEVAVVGLPDEHSGEAVVAYCVRKDPNLTAEELRTFAREKLTAYKVPKQVRFRDQLPKSNVGKLLRRVLRDEAEQEAKG
jgi:long-chain acyl-CoA synthetase